MSVVGGGVCSSEEVLLYGSPSVEACSVTIIIHCVGDDPRGVSSCGVCDGECAADGVSFACMSSWGFCHCSMGM